jgi:antitoxin component of MazEF toxin-antitoxin module
MYVYMREQVKVRAVAGSVVISLPQSVLEPIGLKPGDRVIVEAAPPRRLIVTKEGATMTSTQRMEMEIALLEKQVLANTLDFDYKKEQYNRSMPSDPGMEDNDFGWMILMELQRDRAQLEVTIAKKRLELYDIQAGDTESGPTSPAVAATEAESDGTTLAEQLFRGAVAVSGEDLAAHFTRENVRHQLGVSREKWGSSYNPIFQGMRNDDPGGAPRSAAFSGVFHRVAKGTYELTTHGRELARKLKTN